MKLFILLLLASLQAGALTLSNESIPYYGKDFYNRVQAGERDEALITDLHKIISNNNPIGYTGARKALLGQIHLVEDGAGYGIKEVYCGRVYTNADFPGGLKPGPGVTPDDKYINIEHTWPQSRFTNHYPKDMQKCDMHHLFPTDSKLNSIRGNFWFGEIDSQKQALKCGESKFGTWNGRGQFFEPPTAHKGNVARAVMYFAVRYDMHIDSAEEALLKKWSRNDPVDDEERTRNVEIEKLQGNRNPFVDFPELSEAIADI